MTEERWRELLRRFPGRIIYPDFNPDRKQEPWRPTPPQARDWRRGDTRQVTFIVHRKGWSQ